MNCNHGLQALEETLTELEFHLGARIKQYRKKVPIEYMKYLTIGNFEDCTHKREWINDNLKALKNNFLVNDFRMSRLFADATLGNVKMRFGNGVEKYFSREFTDFINREYERRSTKSIRQGEMADNPRNRRVQSGKFRADDDMTGDCLDGYTERARHNTRPSATFVAGGD